MPHLRSLPLLMSVLAIVALLMVDASTVYGEPPPASADHVLPLLSPPAAAAFEPGEVVVRFVPSAGRAQIDAVLATHGLRILQVGAHSGLYRLAIRPGVAEQSVVRALRRNPLVQHASLNHRVYALGCPQTPATNDPHYCLQWHFNDGPGSINVLDAWVEVTGNNQVSGQNGAGVVVAVIDTGLAYRPLGSHPGAPEWAEQQWKLVMPEGVNLDTINDDPFPDDDHYHGTHVTNTIAQNTHNALFGAGVANGAYILPIKALDSQGQGTLHALAEAIFIAADHGADVLNMSLGFSQGTTADDVAPIGEAIRYAYEQGLVLVAASGNDGGAVLFPAAYPEVIAVGAVKYDANITLYSNRGEQQELTAPGGQHCKEGDLWCLLFGLPLFGWNDQNGDGHPDGVLQETCPLISGVWTCDNYFLQGTSMASPHVAAVAALVIGQARTLDIELSSAEVREILRDTARDQGSPGWDPTYGYGIVDAGAAVAAVVSPATGSIAGIVSDADTGDPIASATVSVDGTTLAGVTDASGAYTITGVSAGDRAVTADADGYEPQTRTVAVSGSAMTTVDFALVRAVLESIAVTPVDASIDVGETQQFVATGTYSDGTTADLSAAVTWASSDEGAATIDAGGLAAGVAEGSTTITATLDGVSGSTTLTVTAPDPDPPPPALDTASVDSIAYVTSGGRNNDRHLRVALSLVDGEGVPVAGASISIRLENTSTGTAWLYAGTTSSDGSVTFSLNNAPAGCYETDVTAVVAAGASWDGATPANGYCK